MTRITIDIFTFEKNRNAVLDTITNHIKISNCSNCQWTVAVVGNDELTEAEQLDKPCLLFINIELELIGTKTISTLITTHNFIENKDFEPDLESYFGNGALLIYCDNH